MTTPNGPAPRKPKPSVKPQSRPASPNGVAARTAQPSQPVAAPTAPALSKWLVISVVGGILMGIISVTTILFFLLQRPALPVPPVAQDNFGPDSMVAVDEKPAALAKLDTAKAAPKVVSAINTNTVAAVTSKSAVALPTEIKPKGKPVSPVFADIEAKGRMLSLPKLEQGIGASTGLAPHELCRVFAKNLSDCELNLSTTEAYEGDPRLWLEHAPSPEPGTRWWIVMSRTKKDGFGDSKSKAIGRFTLHDGTQDHALTFAWDPEVPVWSNPFGLLYCKLDVQVGTEKVACSLSKPTMIPAEKLNLSAHRQAISVGIPPRSLASTEFLRFDLELHLGEWTEGVYLVNVNTSPLTILVVPKDSANGDGRVELDFRFVPPGDVKGAEMSYMAFVFPMGLTEVSEANKAKLPEWKRESLRVDQIDKVFKDGFTIPDFQNIQKYGVKQKMFAEVQISEVQRRIKSLAGSLAKADSDRRKATGEKVDTKVAGLDREVSNLQAAHGDLDAKKRHWQDALKFSEESAAWNAEMRQHFLEIEQKLEVRYSVYLDYGTERVVLAETDPPPKRSETTLPTK